MTTRVKGLIKMFLVGAVILAVGIIIINHTDSFLKIIMIAAGISSFLEGFYTLVGIKRWKYTDATKTLALIKGFEAVAVGIAAVVVALFAAETALTVMVYIFAIGLVFSSVVSFENAFVAKKFEIADMRTHFLFEGVVTLLVAILLFFKPVDTLVKVVQVLAVVFIVLGAIMVVVSVLAIFKGKKKDDVVVEAEVVEENK